MQGGTAADQQKRTPLRWTAEAPGHGFTVAASTWCDLDPSCAGTSEAAGVDVASQRADESSLWTLYRRLIAVRHGAPALAAGDVALPTIDGGPEGLYAILRSTPAQRILFVANLAGADAGPFTVETAGVPAVLEAEGLAAAPTTAAGSVAFTGLAARGFAFLELE